MRARADEHRVKFLDLMFTLGANVMPLLGLTHLLRTTDSGTFRTMHSSFLDVISLSRDGRFCKQLLSYSDCGNFSGFGSVPFGDNLRLLSPIWKSRVNMVANPPPPT